MGRHPSLTQSAVLSPTGKWAMPERDVSSLCQRRVGLGQMEYRSAKHRPDRARERRDAPAVLIEPHGLAHRLTATSRVRGA